MPDPRAGSTPALAGGLILCTRFGISALTCHVAYVTACQAPPTNVTVPATEVALKLPPGWNGPNGKQLNLGETIVYVASGAIIGVGSIVILCTM
jgi:hypothetical protein